MSRSCRRCCLVAAEEGCQENGQRTIRYEVVQTAVASIKEKAGGARKCQVGFRKGTVGQSVKQGCDCSQIGNEEQEEEEVWQKENQMELQWAEHEKLEKIFGTKKDGRKLLAGGRHARGTRVRGA